MKWLALLMLMTSTAVCLRGQNQGPESISQTSGSQVIRTSATPGVWSSSGAPGISLQAGKVVKLPAASATAAYATDPLYADVSLEDGFVTVEGKFAGHTEIIIVGGSNVQDIPVDVTAAPPSYPPGFTQPLATATGPTTGTYEALYSSEQQQVQNILDETTQGPTLTTQLHVLTATLFAPQPGESRMVLPSAFYRVTTRKWDLTLLDQTVANSPLTVNGSTLRGIHFQSGRWLFHAGYETLASFHGFLLPVQTEGAVGAGYIIPLGSNSHLTPNFYYFYQSGQGLTTGHPGGVASLLYEYRRKQGPQLSAEIGAGHGLAGAVQFQDSKPNSSLMFNVVEKPGEFHSLSINNIPGLQSDLTWNRLVTSIFSNSVSFSDNRLLLPENRQNNLTSSETLLARLSSKWSVSTGATYSAFSQTGGAGDYSISSVTLPENISFDLRHFGASFQYGYTWNSQGFAAGQDFRPSIRASADAFSWTAFAEYQTEAIAVDSLYSDIPGLQAELEALGLTASNPAQIQALLQDSTFLEALGLSPGTQLDLIPSRTEVGGNLNWSSRRAANHQVNLGVIYTRDNSTLTGSKNWEYDASYIRQFGRKYNLSMTASLLDFTVSGQSKFYPVVEVGFRRSFSGPPSFLARHKYGTISGTVFEDYEGRGMYRQGAPPLPGVEVVLDGSERTVTDSVGHYSFSHVSSGQHFVEVNFHSDKPFWFTGPSRMAATIDVPANLGIRFAAAELIAYLKNDADAGVEGAQITVTGTTQRVETRSDAQGRIAVPGLGAGEYEVAVDPDSVPAGYYVEDLKPQRISLQNGTPSRLDFQIRALRSVTGQATVYDTKAGRYVPAAGVPVELRELSRTTVTDALGKFRFSDLPAGDFTVVLDWNDGQVIDTVALPPEPAVVRVEMKLARSQNNAGGSGAN
jgi:hypothetical protein